MPPTTSTTQTHQNPSITTLKTNFLASQVRLLTTPLTTPTSSTDSLPPKLLSDLLTKTNDKIRIYNRAVFPAQAQRHVAEQIETLFWNEVVAEREGLGGDGDGVGETFVKREVDFSGSGAMELPEGWADVVPDPDVDAEQSDGEDGADDEDSSAEQLHGRKQEAARYTALHTQLLDLHTRRDEAARKVQRYKQLVSLLEPYESAQERIQPNLVTKDGELMREMERMRVLLARVTARMGEHGEQGGAAADLMTGVEGESGQLAQSFDGRLAVVMADA